MNRKNIGIGVVICTLIVYPVIFPPAHKIAGSSVFVLGIFPIVAAGGLLGLRSLFSAAACAGALSLGLGLFSGAGISVAFRETGIVLVVGLAVGTALLLWRDVRREAGRRKKAEETAARLAEVVDASRSSVLDITPEGTIVNWNSAAEQMYGYTAHEIGGRPFSLLFPPEVTDRMSLILGAAGNGERVDNYETVCLKKDKGLIDVSLTILPVRNGLGRVKGASAVVREITERKVEESLRNRNAELSALFDISSALNETIALDAVLPKVLEAITGLGILYVQRKGAIFAVEGERLRLVCHFGTGDDFVNLHKDMKVGDCLCGLAAGTGEVVLSRNSLKDARHNLNRRSVMYRETTAHGHIVVPLRTKDRVAGALCLFLSADVDVDESLIKLLLSIGNQIGLAVDNARLYEETRALSLLDPLTGLANRRLMDISLEKNFASAKRYERPFSVIMLDLDHFKHYNDTYGHVAGDRLLVDVSRIISREVRDTDLAVRYGGEEFVVLLPETKLERAHEVAERIRERVVAHGGITVSLGVSTYRQQMENKEDIIAMADDAMYRAKQQGRNLTVALKQTGD